MKIAIMQPTFLPWLGYFKMISDVDIFVFLDCVQFEQRSWQSRNKIKLNAAEFFVSLCLKKAPQKTLLSNILLSDETKWKNKLLATFHHAYSKALNYEKYAILLKRALFDFTHLCDLNIFLIESFCKDLGIQTPLKKASKLNINGKREQLLLEICKALKADEYLSPEGSKNYLEKEAARKIFKDSNVEISYFDFKHPQYKQLGREGGFVEYLSALDFLMNAKEPAREFSGFESFHIKDKSTLSEVKA